MDALFSDILSNFWLDSEPVSCGPFGCGHVNKTYLAVTRSGHRYIMQMIGPAFKDVHALQDNIRAVTEHLHRKTPEKHGALTLIPTTEGEDHYHDKTGHTWRVFEFIEDGICLEAAETPMDFYNAALAFGTFQQQLNDFPPRPSMRPSPSSTTPPTATSSCGKYWSGILWAEPKRCRRRSPLPWPGKRRPVS